MTKSIEVLMMSVKPYEQVVAESPYPRFYQKYDRVIPSILRVYGVSSLTGYLVRELSLGRNPVWLVGESLGVSANCIRNLAKKMNIKVRKKREVIRYNKTTISLDTN